MKKYYLLIALLLGVSAAFAVEDMRFVTTLSAPLAVFDKVETSTAGEPAKAKKATIGVATTNSFNTTLKLNSKNALLRTLQVTNNTNISSSNLPVWKTPKITVNRGGALTGKQLQANAFNFTGSGVHTVSAGNNINVTNSISATSGTAKNSLSIADKNWYETVENVPTGGTAAGWKSITGGTSESQKTYTNILYYAGNGYGPRSEGSSSGKWILQGTASYSTCTAGSVMRDSCTDVAGVSGASIANTNCTSARCGMSCVYIPCVSNVYVQYTYKCVC